MEPEQRPFQPVKVGMFTSETGKQRFTKDKYYNPPPISVWRNNLTALSARYNLYFVASQEFVAVYRPEFPYQVLGRTPQLLIPPSLANPSADGYIDPHNPHAINQLVVGDLGTEEILLLATDSGNIAAYHTKSIFEAIRRDPYRFSTNARSEYVGLRAFFCQWVHESAWGLSIHTKARMIAVSANIPYHVPIPDTSSKITVFAFALTGHEQYESVMPEDEDENEDESEWYNWNPDVQPGNEPLRDRNYRIVLCGRDGHESNIPCIAFVNNDVDQQGKWLLSTDIYGQMKLWHIWHNKCHRSWDFGERSGGLQPWARTREGGWLVASLDPKSFRTTKTKEAFIGHTKAPPHYGSHCKESYDISNIVRNRVPGNSQFHPTITDTSDEDDGVEAQEELTEDLSESEQPDDLSTDSMRRFRGASLLSERSQRSSPDEPDHDIFAGMTDYRSTATGTNHDSGDLTTDIQPDEMIALSMLDSDSSDDISDEELLLVEDDLAFLEDARLRIATASSSRGIEGEDRDLTASNDSEDGALSQHLPSRIHEEDPEADNIDASSDGSADLPVRSSTTAQVAGEVDHSEHRAFPLIPTIHCSTSHLRLLNVPDARTPHLFCARMLKQLLPPGIEGHHHAGLDRLNMLQQIPDLGIVVIATQIGRCAVCTLTRFGTHATYGLRVDWVLPTRKQEKAGVRPLSPLLGIAVGPVQGRELEKHDAPMSEHDKNQAWAEDRMVEGIPTSFDPEVLIVQDAVRTTAPATNPPDKAMPGSFPARISKRRRHVPRETSKTLQPSRSMQKRPWKKVESAESWEATENSRRYRLMMTYADMTVLTYELWRDPEQEDIASDIGRLRIQ